ncbi:MAG TPA: nucleotide exchange factor GrpE [Terrimicrobiaceae bacterium]|nr:nucleotide exchange factor GrpE [Terrimicrobiaceae bacterium]
MNTQPDIDPEEQETNPVSSETHADESQTGLAAEVEKYRDAALRARAELDNYRKRVARDKEDAIRYANTSLLENLLPILDNFELGLGAARNATDVAGIVQGLEMVSRQLEDFLRGSGVETIDAAGAPFDPNVHDAVAQEASAEVPEGHVIRQLRKGFKLKDRLIRPASVVVSKGAE